MTIDILAAAADSFQRASLIRPADLRKTAKQLFTSTLDVDGADPIMTGLGAYPSTACGYIAMSPSAFKALRSAFSEIDAAAPIIYAVDDGNSADGDILSEAAGLISSEASPNAWCAVQAKSEGIPSVIGVNVAFNTRGPCKEKREILVECDDGATRQVTVDAQVVVITAKDGRSVEIRDGDIVSIDGLSGNIYISKSVSLSSPPARQLMYILADALEDSLKRFGPIEGWWRLSESSVYGRNRHLIAKLARHPEFKQFVNLLRLARERAGVKIMAAGNTHRGAILGRLFFADFSVDAAGDVGVWPTTGYSGVGLLRTERAFVKSTELDALRALILGPDLCDPPLYETAKATFAGHHRQWLEAVLRANSGCPTVVRALCMPLNKLFPADLDYAPLCRRYGLSEESARQKIESHFRETETFHGCRGARLHTIRPDLTELEIDGVLRASATILEEGGEVDLNILVAMVTFPEEIARYIECYDRVYERLEREGLRLPKARLSMMIETSAAYHLIDRFFLLRGKHIALKGALFGANDLTAATLNFNRRDAVRTVIPSYLSLGVLPNNPFQSLHLDTVGRLILQALERIHKVSLADDVLIGIGGEQAADPESVRWLTRHAAPAGLSYIAASGDMILNALMESAMATP